MTGRISELLDRDLQGCFPLLKRWGRFGCPHQRNETRGLRHLYRCCAYTARLPSWPIGSRPTTLPIDFDSYASLMDFVGAVGHFAHPPQISPCFLSQKSATPAGAIPSEPERRPFPCHHSHVTGNLHTSYNNRDGPPSFRELARPVDEGPSCFL